MNKFIVLNLIFANISAVKDSEKIPETCTYGLERYNSQDDEFKKYLGSGTTYKDEKFPATSQSFVFDQT